MMLRVSTSTAIQSILTIQASTTIQVPTDLALRHTPRLNCFLARVKELTLQFGGKWERSNDQHISIYWPMIGEEGILLDAEVEWDDWENWGKK